MCGRTVNSPPGSKSLPSLPEGAMHNCSEYKLNAGARPKSSGWGWVPNQALNTASRSIGVATARAGGVATAFGYNSS
jgi:hypothetical protein